MLKRWLCLLVCGLLCAGAAAETLALPAQTLEIGEEAFCGAAITAAALPEGLLRIGAAAFRDCTALKRVELPGTLEEIADDSFDGCGEALYFTCPPNCAAADWARASGFDYAAGTVCRALVIAQTYPGTDYALTGSANDARAVRFCLSRLGVTAYEGRIVARTNLDADAILTAVSDAFADAGEDDISLFYYSGHGTEGGELVGADLAWLGPARLRACMDQIPGRKVLVVDACYSGALIQDEASAPRLRSISTGFAGAFLSAFTARTRSAFGGAPRYYVLTAARADQASEERAITSGATQRVMGCFTYGLCLGCGWDGVSSAAGELFADRDADGAVTLDEAFAYASARAAELNPDQTAVVYPKGCTAFSPFRK